MAEKCKECGCKCNTCNQGSQQHCDMHLHAEIENLRQRLLERDNHIVTMETQFLNEADKFPNGELASLKEELLIWQEKYSRLHEAHKRVQKVNQNLEDKLLRIVDKCETEKGAFTKDIATLSHRLADANYTIHRLTQDNEKYRNDVSLAIQLLQCKPSNFVGQKYDSLPSEVQAKVRTYVTQKRCSTDVTPTDVKSITVPISTFPPTAMVYNVTKSTVEKHSDDDNDDCKPPVDVVSAAIMAKVLEDREKERIFSKHCDTCTCHRSILMVDAETQTCISDVHPFSQDMHKFQKQVPEISSHEKHQNKDKLQNSTTHMVFYEINENVANGDKIYHRLNGDCAKYASQVPHIKDKFIIKNSTNANYLAEGNCMNMTAKTSLNKKNSFQSQEIKHSPLLSRLNDLNRMNVDKAKSFKVNKKCDSLDPSDNRSTVKYWNKCEKNSFDHVDTDVIHSEIRISDKEQTQIDIINDRLRKNEWTKLKSEMNARENKCKDKITRGVELDIINDRDWKNDRSERQETRQPTQLTLIEVKNVDNITNQNDNSQTEVTTSPSFSNDSIIISSSDPSSSSSDVAQSLTGVSHTFNNVKSNGQGRMTGPRNCLVRVTPGSKNILLDNAGHYKTILYSSGNKANTALVHTKKMSRSGSERSTSTSSEDNSPVLLQDNSQLQRVAEWVQSSLRVENSAPQNSNKEKCEESTVDKDLIYPSGSLKNCTSLEQDGNLSCNVRHMQKKSLKNDDTFNEKIIDNDLSNINSFSEIQCVEQNIEENLITFDVSNEILPKDSQKANLDYEVKITKEMEETYLKLAASLDPVALSLSNSSNAELTIEKYRKNHKRLNVQRVQDKRGSKV